MQDDARHRTQHAQRRARAALRDALRSPMNWFEQAVQLVTWAAKMVIGTHVLVFTMLLAFWMSDQPVQTDRLIAPAFIASSILMLLLAFFVRQLRPASVFVSLYRTVYQQEQKGQDQDLAE